MKLVCKNKHNQPLGNAQYTCRGIARKPNRSISLAHASYRATDGLRFRLVDALKADVPFPVSWSVGCLADSTLFVILKASSSCVNSAAVDFCSLVVASCSRLIVL
jgi:hypothetical protein